MLGTSMSSSLFLVMTCSCSTLPFQLMSCRTTERCLRTGLHAMRCASRATA